MKINVIDRQKTLPISKPSVGVVLREILLYLSISCEEMSIYFVTEKKITQLHKKFFNDPTPTDCITFPVDETYLGDLFICPEAALKYDPQNPYLELQLYVVHGLLHLKGYDDLDPKKRRIMRKMEKKCMDHLKSLKTEISPP